MTLPEAELRQRLQNETGTIGWAELKPHFERGAIVAVDKALDLIDVGVAMIQDRRELFEGWVASGKITRVPEAQADDWRARQPEFRAVVVAPWVLVQEQ